MLRVLKFYRRGYRVPLDSLAGVIARLDSGVDRGQLENSAAWNNEGPEEKYARIVTGLLREVDPNIDPTGQAHLPSSKDTEEETVEETDA